MKINMEKLEQYLKEDKILEFNSDKECMEYFNTYDYQDFTTVEEMKLYQGRFGFNVGEKRYHINYEEALDVWMYNLGIKEEFTSEEMYILSDAMLELIRTTNNALKLVYDNDSIKALQTTLEKYQKLNEKVCRMLDKEGELIICHIQEMELQ